MRRLQEEKEIVRQKRRVSKEATFEEVCKKDPVSFANFLISRGKFEARRIVWLKAEEAF